MTAPALAAAAEVLVGARFRLHGRDPETGLDCIGLIESALKAIGRSAAFPNGYTMRTGNWQGLEALASVHGFQRIASDQTIEAGDVCLFRPSPAQWHFAIAATGRDRFVEAHASLRRVVLMPGPYPFPLIGRWRLTPESSDSGR